MTDVFGKLLMKPVASYLTRTVSTRPNHGKEGLMSVGTAPPLMQETP